MRYPDDDGESGHQAVNGVEGRRAWGRAVDDDREDDAATAGGGQVARQRPGLVDPESPAVQLGLDAFERALGTRPLLVRSGGTLPIVPALVDKGIPTIVTGFATAESNIHSPNERLLAEYLPLGIETAKELFRSFSTL